VTHARLRFKLPQVFPLESEFPLEAGITALAGPPGAGKTLVLHALAGFARPDAGRILVEDAIVFDGETGVNLPPGRRGVGLVGQRETLFPEMTLKQNLMFAALGWARLERHKRVAEMAERFELADAIEARPENLTPREKLWGEVARALLAEPKVLLIDARAADEALCRRLREAFPGPVLVVTGDLDLCYACADELILLEAGQVVQRGPARTVIERPASVEAAKLVGMANLFAAEIAGLDPGRNSSRLECHGFTLTAPYQPGRFKGDRVTVGIRAEDLRVHAKEIEAGENFVAARLERVSERMRRVRLEFAGGIVAEVPREAFERQRDNRGWWVEVPGAALRVF
jgi:ABC-type sulfate/molybdate transport systems ATPase subunit